MTGYFDLDLQVVRGSVHASYHNDVYERTEREVRPLGLKLEILGGGRIEHLPHSQLIHVYGFSYAFGQAKHELTALILQRWFPLYDTITISDEGY
jgi:phosphohistidine phosphatase